MRTCKLLMPLFVLTLTAFVADAGDMSLGISMRRRVKVIENVKGQKPSETYVIETSSTVLVRAKTAIIVCDMWDTHHSFNAVQRVTEIAPRMNEVLEQSRKLGLTIIHAPSSCMDAYKDHPARKHAKDAPVANNVPKDIGVWCHKIPAEENGRYPIDQSDGGDDSDPIEQAKHKQALIKMGRNPGSPWKSQIAVLKMHDQDFISDSGVEIWNVLEDRKINNIIILGVHTNMCVLGRPFGLRQMAKNGKNVVLMRDMTDTMYNPKMSPYVNHYKGTELIIEHIEKFVCPTITSNQIIGGKAFRFKADPN